jgi:hypothetical protein
VRNLVSIGDSGPVRVADAYAHQGHNRCDRCGGPVEPNDDHIQGCQESGVSSAPLSAPSVAAEAASAVRQMP